MNRHFYFVFFSFFLTSYVYSMQQPIVANEIEYEVEQNRIFADDVNFKDVVSEIVQSASLSNLPYELRLDILQFLEIKAKDINILIKKIYQLGFINQDWRNTTCNLDIWKIIFSNFFRKILIKKSYETAEDIKTINQFLIGCKFVVESIKSAVEIKCLKCSVIDAMSNAFNSILNEVELNLNLHSALNENSIEKFKSLIEEAKKAKVIKFSKSGIWDILLLFRAANKNLLNIAELLLENGSNVNFKNIYDYTPFMEASVNGNKEIMKLFLKNGVHVDARDNVGNSALFWAIHKEHYEIVQMILENIFKRADLNIQNKSKETPLMYSISQSNNHKITKLLLKYKVDVNIRNDKGSTPLIVASIQHNPKIVKMLLNYGACVTCKNYYGLTALDNPKSFLHIKINKILEKHLEKVNKNGTKLSALPDALKVDLVCFLAKENFNISTLIKQISKLSLINRAWRQIFCNRDSWKLVFITYFKFLLNNLAYLDDNEIQKFRENLFSYEISVVCIKIAREANNLDQALTYAMVVAFNEIVNQVRLNLDLHNSINLEGNYSNLDSIIKMGQLLNKVDNSSKIWSKQLLCHTVEKFGCSSISNEIYKKKFDEEIKILLENNVDINEADKRGWTPLMLAAYYGIIEIIELLLEKGANLELKSNEGYTALMLACSRGHCEIVKKLLASNANIEVKNINGETPLILIVKTSLPEKNNLKVIKLLLENNANVNARCADGKTALIYACSEGLKDIVKLLLKHGAYIDAHDRDNKTALFHALEYEIIITYLLKKNADINVRDKEKRKAITIAKRKNYYISAALLKMAESSPNKIIFLKLVNCLKRAKKYRIQEKFCVALMYSSVPFTTFLNILGEIRPEFNETLQESEIEEYTISDESFIFEILAVCFLLSKYKKRELKSKLNILLVKAVYNGHTNLVELLIKNGANVNYKCRANKICPNLPHEKISVSGIAVKMQHHGIVSILLRSGAIFDKKLPQ